jgi:CRP/FNR family transcriptional regulator
MELLIQNKQQVRFRSGETIFKQNTGSSHILCFRSGMAKVYVEGDNNKNLIVKIAKDSEMIVSGGFFSESIRPFTVAAVTEVECCFIDSVRIVDLLFSNLGFARAFLEKYHLQSQQMFNTLVLLNQKYMPGKVAITLLRLKNEVFKTNPFHIPFSRQELADMSAMTKESFVRVLSEFKDSGLVSTHGKTIEILDEKGLTDLSRNG